ncbi:MAG TPA: HEAT repeat domain-containing protein [Gemmataceae bacterium]|nr:HEAT repeat domain-containing protein [Gemmataceae bacterium]
MSSPTFNEAECFIIGMLVGLCLINGGCQPNRTAEDGAERLLRIAENSSLEQIERGYAVEKLGARKEKAAVPRLIRLLEEHDSDALGADVIIALGDIGDPDALPALLHVRDKDRGDEYLPGPINVALNRSIEKLSKKSPPR